jgi:hypothetical protein
MPGIVFDPEAWGFCLFVRIQSWRYLPVLEFSTEIPPNMGIYDLAVLG